MNGEFKGRQKVDTLEAFFIPWNEPSLDARNIVCRITVDNGKTME